MDECSHLTHPSLIEICNCFCYKSSWDLPRGPVVKTEHYNAGGMGLTPGQETRSPHAVRPGQKNVKISFFKKDDMKGIGSVVKPRFT